MPAESRDRAPTPASHRSCLRVTLRHGAGVMTSQEDRPEQLAAPARLVRPIPVRLVVREPVEVALSRLRRAVETAAPAEPQRLDSNRRLIGESSDRSIRLSVTDSRRIGWKVEFVGHMEQTSEGAVLAGEVDIEDHRALRPLMWLLQLGAVVPLLFGIADIGANLASGQPPISSGLFGVGVAVGGLLAVRSLWIWIERAAADDAQVLISFLNSHLT